MEAPTAGIKVRSSNAPGQLVAMTADNEHRHGHNCGYRNELHSRAFSHGTSPPRREPSLAGLPDHITWRSEVRFSEDRWPDEIRFVAVCW
jgi:hypothetical protein